MKKFIYSSLLFATFVKINAQHYCAEHKAKRGTAYTANYNKTSLLSPGYIAPETKYDLKFYHLNVNVERTTLYISGNVRSKQKVVVASLDTFAFLLHQNHTIDSVYVNGAKRNWIRKDSLIKATAGMPIPLNTVFDAIVYYKGICPQGGSAAIGDGYNLGTSGSWGNQVTWSLSESLAAYQWFPCKQDLTDKIDSSWVFATTDSTNLVGSNGLLKNVVVVGAKKRFEWKSKYPIDYYLISVATAKYKQFNFYAKPQFLLNDSVFIQNFIYDNAINNPQWATQKATLLKMKQVLEKESDLFGMYPFYKEKYGHCMAPLGGGMEHQTMSTVGFFDFDVNSHELGHQWWGNNVTCRAWKDIFINEGWASYTEYLINQYLPSISPQSATAKMASVHNNVMSQPGGSSYFTNADTMNANVIFDSRLTYNKGSAIVHSLRYEINNDSVFFPAIRAFQNTYKNNVASVIEFRNFMATYTGINFNLFFNQWYYGQGYPTFNVKYAKTPTLFYLKSTQTQSFPSVTPLFITHVDYRVSRTAKPDTILRVMHTQAIENYTFALTGTVTAVFVDPANWILNKVIGPVVDNTLITTGIEELQEIAVYVGPNPTSDLISVSINNTNKATFEVFDITGKLVVLKEFVTQTEVDISKYANGIYTVCIKNNKGEIIKTSKIVKN